MKSSCHHLNCYCYPVIRRDIKEGKTSRFLRRKVTLCTKGKRERGREMDPTQTLFQGLGPFVDKGMQIFEEPGWEVFLRALRSQVWSFQKHRESSCAHTHTPALPPPSPIRATTCGCACCELLHSKASQSYFSVPEWYVLECSTAHSMVQCSDAAKMLPSQVNLPPVTWCFQPLGRPQDLYRRSMKQFPQCPPSSISPCISLPSPVGCFSDFFLPSLR